MSILDWTAATVGAALGPLPAALLSSLAVLTASLSVTTIARRGRRDARDTRRTSFFFLRVHPLIGSVGLLFLIIAAFNPRLNQGWVEDAPPTLDLVFVLDVSKSMYAEDVTPSRLVAARAAIEGVIDAHPNARFGAIAYAGEPLPFPLTADGPALYGLLRDVEPVDMPVGGTATARALHAAKDLFERDSFSKEHTRVILLMTDGDDSEGGLPEASAALAEAGIFLDVALVGGRTEVPIPRSDLPPEGSVQHAGTAVRIGGPPDAGAPGQIGGPPDAVPPATNPQARVTARTEDGEMQLARATAVTRGTFFPPREGILSLASFARGLEQRERSGPRPALSQAGPTVRGHARYRSLAAWFGATGLFLLLADAFLAAALRGRKRVAPSEEAPP